MGRKAGTRGVRSNMDQGGLDIVIYYRYRSNALASGRSALILIQPRRDFVRHFLRDLNAAISIMETGFPSDYRYFCGIFCSSAVGTSFQNRRNDNNRDSPDERSFFSR